MKFAVEIYALFMSAVILLFSAFVYEQPMTFFETAILYGVIILVVGQWKRGE